MKYRKKPVVVEAIQYIDNGPELQKWSNGVVIESPILEPTVENPSGEYIQIQTLEGCMIGNRGDYIIKGVNGEFYPCKPDIFEKTYEVFEEIGQK